MAIGDLEILVGAAFVPAGACISTWGTWSTTGPQWCNTGTISYAPTVYAPSEWECSYCGNVIENNKRKCPSCGAPKRRGR